ncbi:MAG: hypothetical protein K8I04_05025 [Gammaproteobacteria bacterium]|nr:hypothetical protein [Gammaproteobacteria bacterium]
MPPSADPILSRRHAPLLDAVRRNCHISDAQHAGEYTLCVYLLKMREYFRWEKGYTFSTPLPNDDVGTWLREREQFWETLENTPFADLPINGDRYDPFDATAVNRILNSEGLVYSAGLGQYGRPHFFLGRLEQRQEQADFTILLSADEYARDLAAPPAMTLDQTIFVRRESLRRMIWEKIEEWRWNRPDNAMGRAIQCYDFEGDADAALDRMTATQIDTLLLHEVGEVMAGQILGPRWEEMLAAMPRSQIEFALRAIRDNLADSLSTLPALVQRGEPATLHFFFAMLTPVRKTLAPALTRAYENWLKGTTTAALEDYVARAEPHWRGLALELLDAHQGGADDTSLQALIDRNPL